MVIVRQCIQANKEHKTSDRQYAHVHHVKETICVAGAWLTLPLHIEMGILAHEIGHLLVGDTKHTEEEADRIANKFFKVTIKYKDTIYGDSLQYLSYIDTMKVFDWILHNIKFEGRLFA